MKSLDSFRSVTAALTILACASVAHAQVQREMIEPKDLGKPWPFTMRSGTLECHNRGAIVFVANGKTYTINGTADAYARARNLPWVDVRPIWRDDPSIPGIKIDMGPVIERGQKLCAK